MSLNKAIVTDGVNTEMLQTNHISVAKLLIEIWKSIGRYEKIPNSWIEVVLTTVHKKG